MRFTSLALYSSLIVAAASGHITSHNVDVGSSSSALLMSRATSSHPSSSVANLSLEKRAEEVIEEVDVELDDEEEEDGDDDPTSSDGALEARGKKHKNKSHHRSKKHSGRSGHKKKQHHKKPVQKHNNHSNDVVPTSTGGGKYNGKGTFFRPDQGACGAWNTVNDKIVALSSDIYQGGSHCFEAVRICHGSKCANAKVADLCPGCHKTSLDMSPSLFKELANPDLGVIDIQWSFV